LWSRRRLSPPRRRSMRLRPHFFAWSLLLLALCPRVLAAQGSTATLGGVVRDEQNLVVPAATVTLTGTENSFSRTVTSNGDGGFDFPGVLPGEYLLTVELSGFERQRQQVRLEVNQRVRTDIVLRRGGLTQQVDVVQ